MRVLASSRSVALTLALLLSTGCAHLTGPDSAKTEQDAPDERFVFFASGSSQITAKDGFFSMGYVVARLEIEPRFHALVVGHADAAGSPEANEKLCYARARSVRQVLIDHGITAERVRVAAPKERPDTETAALSRRADIYLYDPTRDPTRGELGRRLGYEVDIREQ